MIVTETWRGNHIYTYNFDSKKQYIEDLYRSKAKLYFRDSDNMVCSQITGCELAKVEFEED